MGKTFYKRSFEMILLVGLTELKAQIAWIDSKTVGSQRILSRFSPFLTFSMHGFRGRRKGSNYPPAPLTPKAEFTFQERCRNFIQLTLSMDDLLRPELTDSLLWYLNFQVCSSSDTFVSFSPTRCLHSSQFIPHLHRGKATADFLLAVRPLVSLSVCFSFAH